MNADWQSFLTSNAADFDGDLATFGSHAALPDCALFDLSHLGLIRVEGEDALEFMQGQFTNDTRELSARKSQLSAYCSPKGRMLGLFRVIERDGAYLLQMPPAIQAVIQKRMQMFVLRSKVVIADASDELARIGLAGTCAEELIAEVMGEVPAATDGVVHRDTVTCVRLGGDTPRFELLIPFADAPDLWSRLAEKAQATDSVLWKLLAIRAGEPTVYSETAEAFVPQMANMQAVNGVSFTKGCYTGQEVVARMQYLGKLKRRMYRAGVEATEAPLPGDELFAADSSSGQGAGRIVESAPLAGGGFEVLAIMEIASREKGDVRLKNSEGPLLEFLDLPYNLTEDDNNN